MKCMYPIFISLLLPVFLTAQPNLTGILPQEGSSITIRWVDYTNPGPDGANQTWDFSQLESTNFKSFSYVDPAGTPYAGDFPDADLVLEDGINYEYLELDGGKLYRIGFAGSTLIEYTDPELLLMVPMAYQESMADIFVAFFNSGGYNYTREGTATIEYDGYGTLELVHGSFDNVIRVHFSEDYSDTFYFGGVPQTINYNNETYLWFLPGNHYPIYGMSDLTVSAGGGAKTAYYLDPGQVSGVQAPDFLTEFSVFPNPATEYATIQFSLEQASEVRLSVVDVNGRELKQLSNALLPAGDHSISASLTELPAGMYWVCIQMGSGSAFEVLVIQ